MASNHRSNECVYDEAYADEAYKQNPQRGIGVRIINLDVPFLPLLNRKCRAGTGLGLGSNAATLLSSGTEEWRIMKKRREEKEREKESERFSFVGRNGSRSRVAFLSSSSLSPKVCASSFPSVLITPQFRSVGPSRARPSLLLPPSLT